MKINEELKEGWCVFAFCPKKGANRSKDPNENPIWICDKHWNQLKR